jgi:enoyl-CoA hydratase/carnithine racemase
MATKTKTSRLEAAKPEAVKPVVTKAEAAKSERASTGQMMDLVVADGVATVTLCRAPVNAISETWIVQFDGILDLLAKRSDWKVLHLRSDQRVFCAGADLNEIRDRIEAPDGPDRMYSHVAAIQRLFARLENLLQVTVAEIGGAAMGGGLELALACDLRVAANEARMGLPEARLGLIPGAGGTQRLTKLCGRPVAERLILGAELIDGATAGQLGIVQWAVPRAKLSEHALEIIRRVASLPAGALTESKACITAANNAGRNGYSEELEATRRLLTDADTRQRVGAFLAGAADDRPQFKKGVAR